MINEDRLGLDVIYVQAKRWQNTVAKQKKPGAQKIRKAIGQQLRYLKRNLGHIARHLNFEPGALFRFSSYQLKCIQVIHTLYEQQLEMKAQKKLSRQDELARIPVEGE